MCYDANSAYDLIEPLMDTQDSYVELKERISEANVNTPGGFSFECGSHFTSHISAYPAVNNGTMECGSASKDPTTNKYRFNCLSIPTGWRRLCKLRATRTPRPQTT